MDYLVSSGGKCQRALSRTTVTQPSFITLAHYDFQLLLGYDNNPLSESVLNRNRNSRSRGVSGVLHRQVSLLGIRRPILVGHNS